MTRVAERLTELVNCCSDLYEETLVAMRRPR